MENSSRRNKASAPVVILSFLMALLLGLGITALLYFWGLSRSALPMEREASSGEKADLTLFTPGSITDAAAPQTAPAPSGDTTSDGGTAAYEYKEVLAEEDGLFIVRIQGKRWKGILAVIDDPTRITVGTCGTFGGRGKTVEQMAEESGAVLAINGGEFSDPGGDGLGGEPLGVVVRNNEILCAGGGYTVGMDYNNKLYAGWYSAQTCQDMGMRWALSYGPTLIMNGEVQSVSATISEPRTSVGQREDGSVIFVIITGRQPSALGVTNQEMAYIMKELGAVNAGNLDGGASSYMYYGGEYLNIPNTSGNPRPVPTSLLVMPKEGGEG